MEYRFEPLEWNSMKGAIGEHLARSFIRNILAPKLTKEEYWTHVLLSSNDYKQHPRSWSQKLFSFDLYREDFFVHGFYANTKLLAKYAATVGILLRNHCSPDGLLLKLRKTGDKLRVKEKCIHRTTSLRMNKQPNEEQCLELAVVEGDLEVIEIKCGRKAKLDSRQRETYNNLIAKGVPLRIVRVRIVPFTLTTF